jgi:hypothetical protein
MTLKKQGIAPKKKLGLTIGLSMRITEWIGRLMATTCNTYPYIYMGTIILWLTTICSRKHTPFHTSNKLAKNG